ncbi:MAG: hypothetical protein ACK5QH_19465 [Rubrivivax sp.]
MPAPATPSVPTTQNAPHTSAPGPNGAAADAPPGRSCPLHYRYPPEVFQTEAPADLQGLEVLYVVGGLYGNPLALDRVLALFARERGRKRLVFNGDFHWFDADPAVFAQVQATVLAHTALRGNVETELASDQDEGCGCAYPDWVGDAVVQHSNRIQQRLRLAATPALRAALGALPMWLRADVGPARIGIVHGDATSLAGWGFAQEHLRDPAHRDTVARWLDRAGVQAFASSHTCLPVFQGLPGAAGGAGPGRWVFNNGAAGMPNFRGDPAGLLTRIALHPHQGPERRFGVRAGGGALHVDALAIDVDPTAWWQHFCTQWPTGSDAQRSYGQRMQAGPDYSPGDALRPAG